jgi:hypothetical protein
MRSVMLAQVGRGAAGVGSEIASHVDGPGQLVLAWVIGGAILIGVIVLLVKMNRDRG